MSFLSFFKAVVKGVDKAAHVGAELAPIVFPIVTAVDPAAGKVLTMLSTITGLMFQAENAFAATPKSGEAKKTLVMGSVDAILPMFLSLLQRDGITIDVDKFRAAVSDFIDSTIKTLKDAQQIAESAAITANTATAAVAVVSSK